MKQSMKQNPSHSAPLLVAACALLFLLSVAPAGFAQQAKKVQPHAEQQTASSPDSKPAGEEQEKTAPGKPGDQGIKIHGHWVLVVKNPDGKITERREFDNSLVTSGTYISGSQLVAALLSGNAAVAGTAIGFVQIGNGANSSDPSSFCAQNVSGPPANIACYVFLSSQGASSWTNAGGSGGLNSTVTFSPTVNIVLSGNFTVPSGLNSVAVVQTLDSVCVPASVSYWQEQNSNNYPVFTGSSGFYNSAASSNACTNTILSNIFYLGGTLTSTYVTAGTPPTPTPLQVTTGQVITVTVTISFS